MGGGRLRSSVVRASAEIKSEDTGFDPLAEQDNVFSILLSQLTPVQTYLTALPDCVRHAPKCVRTLKIPYIHLS